MAESLAHGRRRKFGAGVLDQLATLLSAAAVSVFVAGVIGPYIADALGSSRPGEQTLILIERVTSTVALAVAVIAVGIKGWAKRLDDDFGRDEPSVRKVQQLS